MTFEKISSERLHIVLTGSDLHRLGITVQLLDGGGPQARKTVLFLLDMARMETGFESRGSRLSIEAYPSPEGGCTLSVTLLGRKELPLCHSLVCAFSHTDDLLDTAARLFRQHCHRIYKSSLYRLQEQWMLVVCPFERSDGPVLAFLEEYGFLWGEGEICAAYVREHGEPVALGNAIDRMACPVTGEK